MFKKLKDKLAEEVKSSPQRIQQFAQAAQAAVTSASSSISDITNSDLFSIGDNDNNVHSHGLKSQSSSQPPTFQDVPLVPATVALPGTGDFPSSHDIIENQRQRRLSNSSLASDVSFRLPSYESPSMYHLQSDMEISASEAEADRGFSNSAISLERVTKDQLYAAYRRTQERYTKYRTQYANLAHHYKLLERENAKARSVLVETQDKALRRISELREQCALEQSAKAHLEKALRVDIEERNMKIEALNTKIVLLQNHEQISDGEQKDDNKNKMIIDNENTAQLINLSTDNEVKQGNEDTSAADLTTLHNKIEKMEQLLNKYKESLKATKDKNAQMTITLQKLSNELETKNKESEVLKTVTEQLTEAKQRIQDLIISNEELQNKINSYDFSKTKELSTLELDLEKAKEEILQLHGKIDIFSKREEDYAISLAENKLSIHKELESKEAEIKSLKEGLSAAKKELQSVNIIVGDYKNKLSRLEEERTKLNNDISDLNQTKSNCADLEAQIQALTQKYSVLENSKSKADEQYKCLQLQMKQETAEKLAMIDRNVYLENRNAQLTEENSKKSSQITKLENDFQVLKEDMEKQSNHQTLQAPDRDDMEKELSVWKSKYSSLESEIQEEREELIKLQSEIEKLLSNHEMIQTQNSDLGSAVAELKAQNSVLQQKLVSVKNLKPSITKLSHEARHLRQILILSSEETRTFSKEINDTFIPQIQKKLDLFNAFFKSYEALQCKYQGLKADYEISQDRLKEISSTHEANLKDLLQLRVENENLNLQIQEYKEIRNKFDYLQNDLEKAINKQDTTMKELQGIQKENLNLNSQIEEYQKLQKDYENSQKMFMDIDEKQEATSRELKTVKQENEAVKLQLAASNELQKNYLIAQKEIADLLEKNEINTNILDSTQKDNENLKSKLEKYQLEIEHITEQQREYDMQLKENEELINKMRQESTDKEINISKLKQTIESVSQENLLLKNQSENITKNVKDLESEIDDVRMAHTLIENEKDRLNIIIEQLEKKQQENLQLTKTNDQNTQTKELTAILLQQDESNIELRDDSQVVHGNIKQLEEMEDVYNDKHVHNKNTELETEIRVLKDINAALSNKLLEPQIDSSDDVIENTEKYRILNTQFELLKEENRRLQSDVEGLQTYLTKISKENGVLNDRLRELIASSENSLDKNEMQLSNLTDLKKEVQLGKHRIDDLMRENSILLEENLELKDQILSQNYVSPEPMLSGRNDNNLELTTLKDKYNELLDTKRSMDERLINLEQINKSVNGNMQQMQDGNQKLRLANEKLERRLDEALVSLRHLHSLQENTELEYLRNILYEYLTGSGTHSVTLAKVLSAVVKFDDKQTQQVLLKEKERQGILRQLGLL